ncbi:MAG: glycosyltransferase [Alphaproteobacteria bacterium]|nr:glycosyltransferase [Alphaproteobacteria bacterium]
MNPSVLFLFKSGRKARQAEGGPREFFYGFTQMADHGIHAEMLEEEDLPIPAWLCGPVERLSTRLLDSLAALNAQTLARFSSAIALDRLNHAGAIVATTNAQGLVLGALRKFGLLKTPVLFLPMGVWPFETSYWRQCRLKAWLESLALAPIGKPEAAWLKQRLPPSCDLAYLPFGIDTDFWSPEITPVTEDFVLSIGNDPQRDWPTLAKAWQPGLPPLKIVTRRTVPPSSGQIELMRGDWNSRPLSDSQIRQLYRQARFVVLPIKRTIQPSGQSACLQAMACAKAVILTDSGGLWDDELLIDGQTCLLVPPDDPEALAHAALRLAEDPALAERLGQTALQIVRSRFSIERMGHELSKRIIALLDRL